MENAPYHFPKFKVTFKTKDAQLNITVFNFRVDADPTHAGSSGEVSSHPDPDTSSLKLPSLSGTES